MNYRSASDSLHPGKFLLHLCRLAFRILFLLAILASIFKLPLNQVKADGGTYSLIFTAADPRPNQGPYSPTYERYTPDGLDCPPFTGQANDPLLDAVYSSPLPPFAVDSVTSMAPGDMVLGQIVPFEIVIEVNGDTSPEDGVITFKAGWDTKTTSGDDFGYDDAYGVYCAFIDTADAYTIDPVNDAKVDWFSDSLNGDTIEGDFQISGLDDGDEVVVEVWMVLDNVLPEKAVGNVPSKMISAQTAGNSPDTINVGTQTVPLNKIGEFYTASADLEITKVDVPNLPLQPLTIFDYVIEVTNTSVDTVSNGVVITDTLDVFVDYISVDVFDPGGFGRNCVDVIQTGGGEVVCDLKSLVPQETVPVTITVQILSDAPRNSLIETGDCIYGEHNIYDLCNVVTVETTITNDDILINNQDTEPKDVISVADLGIVVICPTDPIIPLETNSESLDIVTAEFINRVTNYGPDPSVGVIMTDTLPERTTLISYTSNLTATEIMKDPLLVLSLDQPLDVFELWEVKITLDVTDIISYTTVTCTNTAVVTAQTPEQTGATAPSSDSCSVTPVNLTYFSAEWLQGEWNIEWQTALEAGNLGFNLYIDMKDGPKKINPDLIQSESLYSDDHRLYSVRMREEFSQKVFLGQVDAIGREKIFGPYLAGLPFGLKSEKVRPDWTAFQEEHGWKENLRQQTVHQPDGSQSVSTTEPTLFIPVIGKNAVPGIPKALTFEPINLLIDTDGLYRITYEDFLVSGFDLGGIDPDGIAMVNKGSSIPLRVVSTELFGPGSYIEFYGNGIKSIYTKQNVYTLLNRASMAVRIPEIDATPPIGEPVLIYEEKTEINRNIGYSMGSPYSDAWFEKELRSSGYPVSADFEIFINGYSPGGNDLLSLGIWGMTDQPEILDHFIEISMNGIPVKNYSFDGIQYRLINLGLAKGVIKDGANKLTIKYTGTPGFDVAVAIDRYSLQYMKFLEARLDKLEFKADAEVFEIDGFSSQDILIYRAGKKLEQLVGFSKDWNGNGGYKAQFAGNGELSRYMAYNPQALLKPIKITKAPTTNDDILVGQYDYLIISHPDFLEEMTPLVNHRISEGLGVKLIDVTDIFSTFSHRIIDPKAIQEFVSYAQKNMGVKYVLLVGGDTYDYLDYSGTGSISFIPSFFGPTHTFVRHTPLDTLFGDTNGDYHPDVIVGRFPVRSTEEANRMVEKTLSYSSKTYHGTAIFASDDRDGQISFSTQSDLLIGKLPKNWLYTRSYLDNLALEDARKVLIDKVNAGVALVNYFGHSSDQQWADESMFTRQDALSLKNFDRPTLFTEWGCWNTYVIFPTVETLTQSVLLSGSQGGALVFGSATLTSEDTHEVFSPLLFSYLFKPGMRFGDAILKAYDDLHIIRPDLIHSVIGYSIMGDPTVIIQP